jgi:putative hydrolase of the HAD superfamily
MIRALIFDLDDTLFPESEFVRSGFEAVDAWLRKDKAISGFMARASADFCRGARGDIFNRVLRSLGVLDDAQLVQKMVDVYREHQPYIRLFSDAEWALDYFSKTRHLALLTDGYLKVQQRKVAALNISHRFEAIVYSDTFGRVGWKPSPLAYQQITKELSCSPNQCAYVGDNPAKDFITARRLNWFTIRVRRPSGEHFGIRLDKTHEADREIESLLELEPTLEDAAHNAVGL